jgi:hypothetical protein
VQLERPKIDKPQGDIHFDLGIETSLGREAHTHPFPRTHACAREGQAHTHPFHAPTRAFA